MTDESFTLFLLLNGNVLFTHDVMQLEWYHRVQANQVQASRFKVSIKRNELGIIEQINAKRRTRKHHGFANGSIRHDGIDIEFRSPFKVLLCHGLCPLSPFRGMSIGLLLLFVTKSISSPFILNGTISIGWPFPMSPTVFALTF